MDADCTETVQNQWDCQSLDVTVLCASDPAGYNDAEKSSTAVTVRLSECAVSVSQKSVEITEQSMECSIDGTVLTYSDIKLHPETSQNAQKSAIQLELDHPEKKTDFANFGDSWPTDYVVNDTSEVNQSQTSVHELWRPSNPFLDVAGGTACADDSVKANSVSDRSSFVRTLTPTDMSDKVTDRSPLSASAPSDMVTGYAKLQESAPSSVCSASPYESPTHVASGGLAADSTTDAIGNRPDSLYLSRSILQERERQWLAKKGSYSSLSECDSSPAGSIDALIEAATSTPLHSQGTVSMEGDMITFVADGINELIKRSRGGIYNVFAINNILCVLFAQSARMSGCLWV